MDIFKFGTKAETLEKLRGKTSEAKIPEQLFFTISKWKTSKDILIGEILKRFNLKLLQINGKAGT